MWLVDGAQTFAAVLAALDNAKNEILIADWMLSPQVPHRCVYWVPACPVYGGTMGGSLCAPPPHARLVQVLMGASCRCRWVPRAGADECLVQVLMGASRNPDTGTTMHRHRSLIEVLNARAVAGVTIRVMIFNEIRNVLPNDSEGAEKLLIAHPNIWVLRHPGVDLEVEGWCMGWGNGAPLDGGDGAPMPMPQCATSPVSSFPSAAQCMLLIPC